MRRAEYVQEHIYWCLSNSNLFSLITRIILSLWCYVYLNIFTFDHSYSCNYTPLWYITSQFTLLYYVVLLNITLKNVIWCYYLWLELIFIWFILFYNLGFASLYTISRSIVRYERVNMWDNGHTAYHIQESYSTV